MRPYLSAQSLLAARHIQPIRCMDDLAASTFEPGEELAKFLALIRIERRTAVSVEA
jgi:hypothetical protein